MHNIQDGPNNHDRNYLTGEPSGAVAAPSRATLGPFHVASSTNAESNLQPHLASAPEPGDNNIFEFTLGGVIYVATNLDDLLSYDQLLINLQLSCEEYIDYGQPVEQIANDIRSNPSLLPLLIAVNNIKVTPFTREVPRIADRHVTSRDSDSSDSSESDNETESQFNEAMSDVVSRKQSFANTDWRNARLSSDFPSDITDQEFIKSGFYSIEIEDKVQCFSCGGVIENWTKDQNPDDRHAQLFPKCQFIRKKLSARLVEAIQNTLTSVQKQNVAITIPGSRHLYCQPVIGQGNSEQMITDLDYMSDRELELQLSHSDSTDSSPSSPVSWSDREIPANSNQRIDSNLSIDEAKVRLANIVSPNQMRMLNYLEQKVNEANIQNAYKGILNSLLIRPELISEITTIIDSMSQRDCRDHTAEVCDQIKVRFKAASLTQDIFDAHNRIDWPLLLYRAKLLFHEDQLLVVMGNYRLLENDETTEVRAYLKNRFASEICEFTENHIQQRYQHVVTDGYIDEEKYNILKVEFTRATNNCHKFKQFLLNLCQDNVFFEFIKRHDEDLSQLMAEEDSNFTMIMEDYENRYPGASNWNEQSYVAASNDLRDARERAFSKIFENFIESKIKLHWSTIFTATHYIQDRR
ncbi:baculoviral IAP repeat-containing protein [Endozoicomonas sp. ONNA2]|uniref:baculoviral IAP repeat-containing protein n=1 Tax=Endozoicomonas sp. ONNA2 TaxID=2828741 RepID=UPI0021497385|nr:baculoviral IAP repeat-containing protein [Endozoicomonas sp. ONNA2]